MQIVKMASVIFCIIVMAGLGYTQDLAPEEEKSFTNETSLSFTSTSGNTDTLSLAGKNDMQYKINEKWATSWVIGAIVNEKDGKKEAERYFSDLRADYSMSDRWYAYGLGSWLRDKFAGFEHRLAIGPGLGHRYLIGPRHFLVFEGGLNFTYEDYIPPEGDNKFLEGRLFGEYAWAFTEKTRFSQGLEYLQSFDDLDAWKLNAETALITALTDILALRVSYSVYYNHDPRPSNLDNTDTIFTTSLVVSF